MREDDGEIVARSIQVRGVVQGVGFRPFVWREATRLGLTGGVRNRSGVVEVVAEGSAAALDEFCRALRCDAPPLARVEDVTWGDRQVSGATSFEVEESVVRDGGERLVPLDAATCGACLAELFDPADRRYRYPFINCTDCGPRFTIIEALPYDRERTSMRSFPMCDDCAREYHDPSDRRFHAEPIACPECGPTLDALDRAGRRIHDDPIDEAVRRLARGEIVAIKGLGGFHLACDATNERAVRRLRRRKRRPDKPFAVMAADLEAVRARFSPTRDEERELAGERAPIVLVDDRGTLAQSVAPGFRRQGVMLPSTPVHHLLARDFGRPLVMTSGNRSDEPICISNEDALDRLGCIADAFLVHDRSIVARYDDSVVQEWRAAPLVVRRARSFAPAPIDLPRAVAPTLGTGAELHGAFCLAAGTRAYLSQHVGDLDSDAAMDAYEEALSRYRSLFAIQPEVVAHDLHPDFLTTRLADRLAITSVAVQHHHAHVATAIAEHGLDGPVIGVTFDGFGLGTDGTSWGGEFLVCDGATATRAAHLNVVALPGGDAAVRRPWRMALAHAEASDVLEPVLDLLTPPAEEAAVVARQIRAGDSRTSSVGRLFDAVAALVGLVDVATYEGHPAIALEQIAERSATREYPFEVGVAGDGIILDSRPMIAAIVADVRRGRGAGEIAGRFHRTLAAATLEVCRAVRGATGLTTVCLGGGVFNNRFLTGDLVARLETFDFDVHVPRQAPVGDGGLALGQVVVANLQVGGG
jgi:hydrogenase maturation protein HypF